MNISEAEKIKIDDIITIKWSSEKELCVVDSPLDSDGDIRVLTLDGGRSFYINCDYVADVFSTLIGELLTI